MLKNNCARLRLATCVAATRVPTATCIATSISLRSSVQKTRRKLLFRRWKGEPELDVGRREERSTPKFGRHKDRERPHFCLFFSSQRNINFFLSEQQVWNTVLEDALAPAVHIFSSAEISPAIRINPRFRILRNDAADSDRFDPHYDEVTEISGLSSRLTVLVYLNSGRWVDID